jgi:hypothetical protein
MEAKAALLFFLPSGSLRGRHTTDEFLVPVWRVFAKAILKAWSARRRQKLTVDEIRGMTETWVEGRFKRARRFIDKAAESPIPGARG